MSTQPKLLAELWEAHCQRKYPHNRPEGERGSSDFGGLIDLDAHVAGYVSRIVQGERLARVDLQSLAQASLRVREISAAMSGETRSYFLSLAHMAEVAEAGLTGLPI